MIEIKVLSPDDWRLWRALRLRALADVPHAFGATLAHWQGDGDREQRWRARLAIPGSRNLVARIMGGEGGEEDPVGMASGVPARGDADAVELISLWVAPAARGRGVAARLLGDVEQWAARLGRKTLRLSVMPSNEDAVRLYRRCGFCDTGERGGLAPDGTGWETVMAKRIAPTVIDG
ncbi:hypothetical protein VTH06DRAFT_5889 [Thermothelomyces fergusii]